MEKDDFSKFKKNVQNYKYNEKVFSEVLSVMRKMDKNVINKVPRKFIQYVKSKSKEEYLIELDSSKKLDEQISHEAKVVLALIYDSYCNN